MTNFKGSLLNSLVYIMCLLHLWLQQFSTSGKFNVTEAISKIDGNTQSLMMGKDVRLLAETFQDVAQSNNRPPLFIHNFNFEPALYVSL